MAVRADAADCQALPVIPDLIRGTASSSIAVKATGPRIRSGATEVGWPAFNNRHPGLDPGSRFFFSPRMDRERRGGWVYIMADRYRGGMYVGVTAHLAARVHQHRSGGGSVHCAEHKLTRLVWAERGDDISALITHEKRMKRWRREWKFALIERGNPEWRDLSELLV